MNPTRKYTPRLTPIRNKIIEAKRRLQLSTRELAARLGVSPNTLAHYADLQRNPARGQVFFTTDAKLTRLLGHTERIRKPWHPYRTLEAFNSARAAQGFSRSMRPNTPARYRNSHPKPETPAVAQIATRTSPNTPEAIQTPPVDPKAS